MRLRSSGATVGKPPQCFLDIGLRARTGCGPPSANPCCRQVSGAEGDCHREGASMSDLAGDANGATVKLDQFLDQGEADPAALDRAPACALHSVEPLKQMRQLFRGDTGAG